ncbi:MAG: condensation domain-containing protein [Clostridia bacterium]|nr:condensation domain-containing protein [Clostridia bacterium]
MSDVQKKEWSFIRDNINQYPDNHSRHIGGYAIFEGIVDFYIFQEAINIFVKRNDGIRLRYKEIDGEVYQYVSEYKKIFVDFFDFSNYDNPKIEFDKWLEKDFSKSFSGFDNDLFYFALLQVNKKQSVFYGKIHHLNYDGWSFGIMVNQIFDSYIKIKYGEESDAKDEISYLQHLTDEKTYLLSERLLRDKCFWNTYLKGYPELFCQPIPMAIKVVNRMYCLNKKLTARIKKFCSKRLSLSSFFISVLSIYLYIVLQRDDILIGSYMSNRGSAKEKKIIGCFAGDMPLRIKIDENQTFYTFADKVCRNIKRCLFYSKYPKYLLAKDLKIYEKGYSNLYQISVNYNVLRPQESLDGIKFSIKELYTSTYTTTNMQIEIIDWLEHEDKLLLNFIFMQNVFSEGQIESIYNDVCKLIDVLLENSHVEICDIKLGKWEISRNYLIP